VLSGFHLWFSHWNSWKDVRKCETSGIGYEYALV
jgi:hypothetical protein